MSMNDNRINLHIQTLYCIMLSVGLSGNHFTIVMDVVTACSVAQYKNLNNFFLHLYLTHNQHIISR